MDQMTASALLQGTAVLLQLATVIFAIRLIRVTGRMASWLFISGALCLMIIRRSLSLWHTLAEGSVPPLLVDAATAAAISFFMLVGVAAITPLFLTIRRSQEALRQAKETLEMQVAARTEELRNANERLQEELSQRRRAEAATEAERQRLYALLEALPALVYLKAPDYSIRFGNRKFREDYGNYEGQCCYEAFGRTEVCENCVSMKVLETGTPIKEEWVRPNGARIYEFIHYPFNDIDGSPLVMTLGIDITERKRVEEQLRESEENLRNLASQLLTAQEKERRRISRELHDELGQSLLVLKLQMAAMWRKAQAGDQTLAADCGEILGHLDGLVEDVRRLSKELGPSILEDLGFAAAVRRLLGDFSRHYRIDLKLSGDLDGLNGLFSSEDQIHIYRIFQEWLTNIGKHSGASSLQVTIELRDQEVSFVLADNGRGFELEMVQGAAAATKGIGLATMKERARLLGGKLNISSQPGSGTKIDLILPLRSGN